MAQTREFFTSRASGWEDRHPDDDVSFKWAVDHLGLSPGDAAVDAGCGSGRALAPMRDAVGSQGAVLGIDATPAMLHEASRLGRQNISVCALGDVGRLPVRDNCVPGSWPWAASSPARSGGTLREMARSRSPEPGGVFHPSAASPWPPAIKSGALKPMT